MTMMPISKGLILACWATPSATGMSTAVAAAGPAPMALKTIASAWKIQGMTATRPRTSRTAASVITAMVPFCRATENM